MKPNLSIHNLTSPEIFDPVTGFVDRYPSEVLQAAEDFISPDLDRRKRGFEALVDRNAFAESPLLGYILVSRILENDLPLRAEIVAHIAYLLELSNDNRKAQEESQAVHIITHYLSQMRNRQIYALLQTALVQINNREKVAVLLRQCSFAGNQLVEIVANREFPLSIRKEALYFIREIGFTVAIPTLERLGRRYEEKMQSSRRRRNVNVNGKSEIELLPIIQETLELLKTP